MRDAGDLLVEGIGRLTETVRRKALEHRDTLMAGRTHGVHAEPTTFGLKLAGWAFELARDRDRLRRGPGPGRRREALRGGRDLLAARPRGRVATCATASASAIEDAATQVVPRDRHAEFLAAIAITGASLERFAQEIRHLQRTEVREAQEPFAKGQKGSSRDAPQAQPDHVRADLRARPAAPGLSRRPASRTSRCGTSATSRTRSVERVTLRRRLHPARLHARQDALGGRRADRQRGADAARTSMRPTAWCTRRAVLTALLAKGTLQREEAYALVQRNAMAAWDEEPAADGAAEIRPRGDRAPRSGRNRRLLRPCALS